MTTQFTLPRDAEGREVPLDTNVMYNINGKKLHITKFALTCKCDGPSLWTQWKVLSPDIKSEDDGMLPTESLYLTQPDSWERLEKDVDRAAKNKAEFDSRPCAYMNNSDIQCGDCKFNHGPIGRCQSRMFEDIVSRIHNLRNED